MSYNPINENQRSKNLSTQISERSTSQEKDSSLVCVTSAFALSTAMGKVLGDTLDTSSQQTTCTEEAPATTTNSSSSTAAVAANMEQMQKVLGELQLMVAQYKTSAAQDQTDLTKSSLDNIQAAQQKWQDAYDDYQRQKRMASWLNPIGFIMHMANLMTGAPVFSQNDIDTADDGFTSAMDDVGEYTGLSEVNYGISYVINQTAQGFTWCLEQGTAAAGVENDMSDKIESLASIVLVSAVAAGAVALVCPEAEGEVIEGAGEEAAPEAADIEMDNLGEAGEEAGVEGAAAEDGAVANEAGEAGNNDVSAHAKIKKAMAKIKNLLSKIGKKNLVAFVFSQGLLGSSCAQGTNFSAQFAETVTSDKHTQQYITIALTIGLSLAAAVAGAKAFGPLGAEIITTVGAPVVLLYLQQAMLILNTIQDAQKCAISVTKGLLEEKLGAIEQYITVERAKLDTMSESCKETQENSSIVLQNVTTEITSITQAVAKSGQAASQALSA